MFARSLVGRQEFFGTSASARRIVVQKPEQRRDVEVEHSGVNDHPINEAIDAGGRQIDALAGVAVFRLVSPLHRDVIVLCDEAWLKTARVRGLEAIPGGAKTLSVSLGSLVPMILS